MKYKISLTILILCLWTISSYCEVVDHYDQSGKINSVIAVVVVTILGIAAFLFFLEKRIKKLENQFDDE